MSLRDLFDGKQSSAAIASPLPLPIKAVSPRVLKRQSLTQAPIPPTKASVAQKRVLSPTAPAFAPSKLAVFTSTPLSSLPSTPQSEAPKLFNFPAMSTSTPAKVKPAEVATPKASPFAAFPAAAVAAATSASPATLVRSTPKPVAPAAPAAKSPKAACTKQQQATVAESVLKLLINVAVESALTKTAAEVLASRRDLLEDNQERLRKAAQQNLTHNLLEHAVGMQANAIITSVFDDRVRLKQHFRRWRKVFQSALEVKSIRRERLKAVRTAAAGLGVGGGDVDQSMECDEVDLKELLAAATSSSTVEADRDMVMAVENVSSSMLLCTIPY